MDINEACRVIEGARGDAILVATMGAMTAFDQLGAAQPRINSVPLMGGAASIGLGLAIGRPDRRLIVVDGDASLLMQLGGLATVAERQPRNFHHFVIRNGTQFSGFSNLATPAEEIVDFAAMAKAAGYRRASGFDDGFAFAEALPAIRWRWSDPTFGCAASRDCASPIPRSCRPCPRRTPMPPRS